MNFFLTALAFIVIFSILVLIHECGHFFAARKSGIKVEEFGFGLPPRLWGVKKGETLYSLNAIPFGGFVRLFGEDESDPKVRKNPRSYSGKSIRTRTIVVLAGVFMNFLLAWVLLTIGFSFGIQPLILTPEDGFKSIQNGTIEVMPGAIVKDVKSGSPADKAGVKPYDKILTINHQEILSSEQLQGIFTVAKDSLPVEILRGDQKITLEIAATGESAGFTMETLFLLPRLMVKDITADSPYYVLHEGDILLKLNDQNIYGFEDFQQALQQSRTDLDFLIQRNEVIEHVKMEVPMKFRTVVSQLDPGLPAEKAGINIGDTITAIDQQPVYLPQDLQSITQKSSGKALVYHILRNNKPMELIITPNQAGKIGVGLTSLYPSQNNNISFFSRDIPTSIIKINNVSYPFWIAPIKALEESARLSVLTVQMFGNVIRSLIADRVVPEGVTGPVGIFQMTSVFVQEGFLSLLRFMALLSLSLAIINVLPLPALDGGRFLFILIEIVVGKKVNPRYESIVHTIGFVFLLLLIVMITYSDILKLF